MLTLTDDQSNKSGLKIFLYSAIIILVLGILAYLVFSGRDSKKIDEKSVYADSVAAYNLGYTNGYAAGQKSGYQAARQLYADSLSSVQGMLINCMGKKIKKPVAHYYRKPAPMPKKEAAYITTPNQFMPSSVPAPKQQPAPVVNIVAPTIPDITVNPKDGDVQVINVKGKLCFIFNESLVAKFPKGNFRLNGADGPLFTLYNDGNYKLLSDITCTSNMIGERYLWNVYIGNNPSYGFEMYITHEDLKAYLLKVRGTEAGKITPEDLIELGKYLPAIKSGDIIPNGVYAKGKFDGLEYGGWDFATLIK